MDKIMKNKRALELVTSLSSGYKTFRKFSVIIDQVNFDDFIQSGS